MPETGILQILVNGGLASIALTSLWIIYKMNQLQNENNKLVTETLKEIARDHRDTIDRNTDAWNKNTEVLAKLNERIK